MRLRRGGREGPGPYAHVHVEEKNKKLGVDEEDLQIELVGEVKWPGRPASPGRAEEIGSRK